MVCCENRIERLLACIAVLAIAVVSIPISAWQYQNDANGNHWAGNWDDACKNWPLDMLRPIRVKPQGQDNYSYCGYSDANTGYRLGVACLTVLTSLGMFCTLFEKRQRVLHTFYWVLFAMWFLAGGMDIQAVANGERSCEDGFPSNYDCDNSVYGVTIAIDVAACIVLAILIYAQFAATSLWGL